MTERIPARLLSTPTALFTAGKHAWVSMRASSHPALASAILQADWLSAKRAMIYCRMLAAVTLIQAVHLLFRLLSSAAGDPQWRPETTDFNAFWSGAVFAVQGHAQTAYDPVAMAVMQGVGAQPALGQFLPYMNPPIFLLLCAPLGMLPYLPAMVVFVLGGYAAFIASVRRILPRAWPLLPILAFPAAMLNGTDGQNGFISATAYACGMLFLERRPVIAGLCLGLLSFKPHLAICVPFALLASRRWSVFAAFMASVGALACASYLLLGSSTWMAFIKAAPIMRHILVQGATWPKMQSTYAAVRILHGDIFAAFAAQLVVAIAGIFVTILYARRRPGAGPEMAATVVASLLCTPYSLDYDLVCLAVPMAWIARRASITGWQAGEKAIMACLYIYPLEARSLNLEVGLPIAPILMMALVSIIVKDEWSVSIPATESLRICMLSLLRPGVKRESASNDMFIGQQSEPSCLKDGRVWSTQ